MSFSKLVLPIDGFETRKRSTLGRRQHWSGVFFVGQLDWFVKMTIFTALGQSVEWNVASTLISPNLCQLSPYLHAIDFLTWVSLILWKLCELWGTFGHTPRIIRANVCFHYFQPCGHHIACISLWPHKTSTLAKCGCVVVSTRFDKRQAMEKSTHRINHQKTSLETWIV